MTTRIRPALLAMAFLTAFAACEDDKDNGVLYRATLSGANEVPARTTTATGSAQFRVRDDNTITYTVDVTNLQNISAGHIHGPATATTNAGVIIGLFTTPPTQSPFTGRLAEGTITAASTLNGVDFEGLLALFEAGTAYVNLHSNDGVDPANTGPGDFPGGEIRGHITRAP